MILPVVSYAEVRDSIHTMDIAVYDGEGFGSAIIEQATGAPYGIKASHVGVLLCPWSADVLMTVEAWERESRCVEFSTRVQQASGRVRIFRLRLELLALINIDKAVEFALRATPVDYPENHLVLAAMAILSGRPTRRVPNSSDPKAVRQCSELLAAIYRMAGLPPQAPPKDLDCMNWPVDWSNPAIVTGLWTLTYP